MMKVVDDYYSNKCTSSFPKFILITSSFNIPCSIFIIFSLIKRCGYTVDTYSSENGVFLFIKKEFQRLIEVLKIY